MTRGGSRVTVRHGRQRDFGSSARDAIYYARAFEAPKPGINGGNVRCERDASGACQSVQLCAASGDPYDDCLAEIRPRAWSSPIYTDFGPEGASASR